MKRALVKLSICPCGENVLLDDIQVGTEYHLKGPTIPVTYICGKCGRVHRYVPAMWASRPGRKSGYIPIALFGIDPINPDPTRN